MTKQQLLQMTWAALFLAIALLLPFVTGQIPRFGQMLAPMHLPVLLCGFFCGWKWGSTVGLVAPLLRSVLFGMPPIFPVAVAMAAELAVYGLLTGLCYRRLPKRLPFVYLSLGIAMIGGRAVWGGVRFALAGLAGTAFPFSAFVAGALTDALPGILLQLVLVPVLVLALQKHTSVPT